jgi:hypothetical protein
MAEDKVWQFIGTEETMGVLCDVFLVATDRESKISTIYFFQSQTKIPDGAFEGTRQIEPSRKARCIARIMLSSQSMDVLLKALADNRGLMLASTSPSVKEEPKQ